ncbi:MAG: hypothetical protein ABSF44_08935 [Candidatus Bathyarchaeia archaeon]
MSDDLSPIYPDKPFCPPSFKHIKILGLMLPGLHEKELSEIHELDEKMMGCVSPTSHIQIYLKNVLEDTKDFIIENTLECPEIAFEFQHNFTYLHEILHRTWRWTPSKKRKGHQFENEEEVVEILALYITWLLFARPEIHDGITEKCRQLLNKEPHTHAKQSA